MEILNNRSNKTQSTCCNNHCGSKIEIEISNETSILQARNNEIISTFKVINMDCADEIKAIKDALKLDGVLEINANIMASTVQVLHEPHITREILHKKIETTVVRIASTEVDARTILKKRTFLVATSGLFLGAGLISEWLKINEALEIGFFLFSLLLAGTLVFPKALGAIKRSTLDMNVLMTMATIGAIVIKEYSEAGAVVFLFALSELLESMSVQKARSAILELLSITPDTANVVDPNGSTLTIPVEEVKINQMILVRAGEKIPLDAEITRGESTVNQAPLTGESIPVLKTKGDSVFAGTINQDGSFEAKVTKVFSDTKISQVIKLVAEAQNQKANSQKFVDRFAKYYTPTVLVVSLLIFIIPVLFLGGSFFPWFYKALTLLVIACPCALVISTPVSIVSGLTILAKKGVLVKGGIILEDLGQISAVAFDKTGTLTKGEPAIQRIMNTGPYDDLELMTIAASVENHSTHPFALAILRYAQEKGASPKEISYFKNSPGLGIEAQVEGKTFFLGSKTFLQNFSLASSEIDKIRIESQAVSLIYIGEKTQMDQVRIIGMIHLADEIKAGAKSAIQDIKDLGIKKILILSGDNQKSAESMAQLVGINDVRGNLLPEDKLRAINELKRTHGKISMIGDGINDAPAMASSTVSIAMGAAGSDVAINVADVALMTDDISLVAQAIKTGRRTLNFIKFNITFSLVTKALFLVLTFLGMTNLWLAVAADTGVALLVIMNSLRLLKD